MTIKRELVFPKTRDFSEVHHCDSVYSQGKDTSGQVKRHSQQRRMRRRQIMRRGFSILIIIFSSGSPTELSTKTGFPASYMHLANIASTIYNVNDSFKSETSIGSSLKCPIFGRYHFQQSGETPPMLLGGITGLQCYRCYKLSVH